MSGSGTSTIIADPAKNWGMLWGNHFRNFQLDIVGFLAVLGEGSVTANAQVSALSPLFYLPRLIPAPQALLWPSRPVELPPTKATVTGVESEITKEHVHHVANVLLGCEMEKFTVRCVRVTKAPDRPRAKTLREILFGVKRTNTKDPEKNQGEKEQGTIIQQGASTTPVGPAVVTAKANGPLSWVTLASCFLSISMFIISIACGDGFSLLATLMLSFLSTLIGIVNKSTLSLPQRPKGVSGNIEKEKHVVIRYPNGSFLVVKCDENVARELYFAPEEITYSLKSDAAYRLISLVGTLLLMAGVIFLANARLQLQFAWGGAYIITNILHWVAAAVPARHHWDLSCYIVQEQGIYGGPTNDNFTEALWKAIVFTGRTDWIPRGAASPSSHTWETWRDEMERHVKQRYPQTGRLEKPELQWRKREQPPTPEDEYTIWEVPYIDAKEEWEKINKRCQEKLNSGKEPPVSHSETWPRSGPDVRRHGQ